MTRPTKTAGDLLAQRPHTTLPADDDDEDDGDDDGGDDDAAVGLSPQAAEAAEAEEGGWSEWVKEAGEQYADLLDDADENQTGLTDYQRYTRRLKEGLLKHIYNIWSLAGPTEQAAAQIGAWVQSGQEAQSYLTQLYADRSLGAEFTPFMPGPGILERPSASKVELYSRPRRERSMAAQLSKLSTLAVTDLQLAKTRTLYSAFDEDQEVNRNPIKIYKRVTESEKPCALCIIASDQVYFTTDLMPIHDNCECDVVLADGDDLDEHKAKYHHIGWVQSLLDTGDNVKAIQTLADEDADASEYHNLVAIRQHGDLGPVLTWSDHKFTGPKDLPNPMGFRPAPSISGPGRGHEARLQRNAARVAAYRRQHGHGDMRYAPGHGGITSWLPPVSKVTKPIPLRPKPTLAPVIPIRPKGIDFEHDSLHDVVSAVASKHSSVGFDKSWEDPQYNETAKRRVLQALDEMLTKYPDVKVGKFGIADLESGVYAETTAARAGTGTDSVIFNKNLMTQTPEELAATTRHNVNSGWFYTGAADNPYRYIATHEYGHVLGNRGYRRANPNVDVKLLDLFNKSGRGTPKPEPIVIDRKAPLNIQSRDLLRNIDAREAWIKSNDKAMTDWLAEKDRVSGYSMIDQAIPGKPSLVTGRPGRVLMNPGEALAEAFAHVELNPEGAKELPKALHDMVVEEATHPQATAPAYRPYGAAAIRPKESAVERLRKATEPRPNWTKADMDKEDNFAVNKADEVILSDEQRALARQLATNIWIEGAKVEPDITAATVSTVQSLGGQMSGLAFRQKTGPSLYRKIQAEAIDIANGRPVEEKDLRTAAANIKDAVRYTALMPEEGYWASGSGLRKALESLGAKTIKDPVGIPLKGYRGRNFAFTLNGTPFEMQVNTELGVAIKDEAHQIYNVSRKLEDVLKAKGVDPLSDPAYVKMLDDMQAKWDTIPVTKGTPIVQTEKDVKSGDLNKILYTAKDTRYRGPSIPGGELPLDAPEMVGRARVPSTRYGMEWLPDSPEAKIVAPAREISDAHWNTLPVQHLPHGTVIKANEGTLSKDSIDRVVSGTVPFREGYPIKLYRTDDGALHVVDGHTRIAMYNALNKDLPVQIMDESTLERISQQQKLDTTIYDTAKANGGITIDLAGNQPAEGYAYAPRKDTERKILKSKLTPEDIDQYIDDHHELLAVPGNHLGLWEEGNYFYLDVSRVGKPTAATIASAQRNDQLGVFDLKHFATIDIGKIDKRGNYVRLGKASDLHAAHQGQIARDAERASAPSTPKVPASRHAATRYGPGGEFHAPYPVDPNDVPDRGIDFLSHQHMVDNILARYNDTVGDKAWIREAGRQWYPAARGWVLKMLDATGSDMDLDKAAAIVAQYSENASWTANMARAMNYFSGKPTGAFKATDRRTKAIAASDDPLSMVKGPKINNFVRAILGQDRFPDAVAVDRWAARIALGNDDKALASKVLGRTGGYEALADAYRDAARQLGIAPPELQAITWVHAVPADATVRAFKEAGEWHF